MLPSRKSITLIGIFIFICSLLIVKILNNEPMLKSALDPYNGYLLKPLLKPRVPGTPGALKARNHIVSYLERAGWNVSPHHFVADTPHGHIPMANILAEKPGRSKPQLTLAAHYDSKRSPHGFVGAIDSAFPCALLLYLASINRKPKTDFNLIFFDGEEAFENWSETDSLYGAKALAQEQHANNSLPNTLVLLDLIGNESRFPIPSWFAQTEHLHRQLSRINPKLVGGRPVHQYSGMMQDDHIPFYERGVPVLHLIPVAFPDVWHTTKDNADNLHWETMEEWADLMEKWLFD